MGAVSTCVFCEIVAGGRPARRVLEDEHAVAFLNIRPAAPGHTLVVPRTHGDGLRLTLSSPLAEADELERAMARIRSQK